MMLLTLFGVLLCTITGAVAQNATCFDDTTDVFNFLADNADGSSDITVSLCPNTIFRVGNLNDQEGGVEDGSMPLIGFPRVQYLCGSNGDSSDNCILQGGEIQFWNPPGAAVEDLTVRGVTFQGATFVSILLQGTGDIEFVDCIIQDHVEAAPVIADNFPFRRKNRALGNHRKTQANSQSVMFQNCVFANNAQRDSPALFTYGVITLTSIYNSLVIGDCEFYNNVYDEDFGTGTYLIRSFGGPVDVTDSTFCGNSVLGFGLVQLFSYDENVVASNNGGSMDDNLTCPFLAVSESIPEEERQVTCVSFDAGGCVETDTPTLTPTADPTPVPTSVPIPEATATSSPYPTPTTTSSPYPTPTPAPSQSMTEETSAPVATDGKSTKTSTKKKMMMHGKGKGKGSSTPTESSSPKGKGASGKGAMSKGKGSDSSKGKGMAASKDSTSKGPSMSEKVMTMKMMMQNKGTSKGSDKGSSKGSSVTSEGSKTSKKAMKKKHMMMMNKGRT